MYPQENRQSSLLDFNPLLSDGDWRLMWKANQAPITFKISKSLSKFKDRMNLLGLSFVLYVLKLSSGSGFWSAMHKFVRVLGNPLNL